MLLKSILKGIGLMSGDEMPWKSQIDKCAKPLSIEMLKEVNKRLHEAEQAFTDEFKWMRFKGSIVDAKRWPLRRK